MSFSPLDSGGVKTITWDPSLNSNSFWDPNTIDNQNKTYDAGKLIDSSVRITKNYSAQNNYQVYISSTQQNSVTNQQISGKKYPLP